MGIAPKKTNPDATFKRLIAQADEQLQLSADALANRKEFLTEASHVMCPYEVGQTLVHKQGLGPNGMYVSAIVAVQELRNPGEKNRWAVQTWALSKSGEVTARSVYIDEAHGFEITIR